MSQKRRLRVLVSAYACRPNRGSEPGIGWNWVEQIARFHDVWVITRANNRPFIEAVTASAPISGVTWVYHDIPLLNRLWDTNDWGVQIYYYLWQLAVYPLARDLHRQHRFDISHHVTFVKYWAPSLLALLPIPFVWGPVGGGESAPRAFYRIFSYKGRIKEHLRDSLRWLEEFDPFVRLPAQRAYLGFATTEETTIRLRRLGIPRVKELSQVALSAEELDQLSEMPPRSSESFRVVSIGNLIHLKGIELSLQAFARLVQEYSAAEYWIVGDGPDRERLERLAQRLSITDEVRFLGWQTRTSVLELLAECDVLLFPSLHDSGGMAVTEAMAAGRPVICLDLGGPAVQVTTETGIKVSAITPEQVVDDLAGAMLRLAEDSDLRRQMGAAGRARVREHFNWDRKGDQIAALYEQIVSR